MAPIYLLADSQLLFLRGRNGRLFLDEALRQSGNTEHHAAYIGVSNGDSPAFASLFAAALEPVGNAYCQVVTSAYSSVEAVALKQANVVLLAGGDVARGWRIIERTGIGEAVRERYAAGAILIGISAGAVQLGKGGLFATKDPSGKCLDGFQLVDCFIDVHDEANRWKRLRQTLKTQEPGTQGIGIPTGGGMVYHQHAQFEAIRRPLIVMDWDGMSLRESILHPDATGKWPN